MMLGVRRVHLLGLIAIGNIAFAAGAQTDTSAVFNRTFDRIDLVARVERPAVPPGQPPSGVVTMHFKGGLRPPADCFLVASHQVSGLPESGLVEMFQGRDPLVDGMTGFKIPGEGDGNIMAPTVFVAGSAGGVIGLGGGGAWRVRQSIMFENRHLPNRSPTESAEPQPATFPYTDGPLEGAVDNWGLGAMNSGFCVTIDAPTKGSICTRTRIYTAADGKTRVLSDVLNEHVEFRLHLATVLYVDADPTFGVEFKPHSRFDWHLIWDFTVKKKMNESPANLTIAPYYPVQVFELGFADPSDAGDLNGAISELSADWGIAPFRTDATWP